MPTELDLWRAAYREAGHCVMAYTVGQKPEGITLPTREGPSYRWQTQDDSDLLQAMQTMTVLAAGSLCERLGTQPSYIPDSRHRQPGTDLANLASLHAARGRSADDILERVFTRAAGLLSEPRRLEAVHSLASALVARRSVSVEEVVEILQACGVRKSLTNLFLARAVFGR